MRQNNLNCNSSSRPSYI